MAFYSMVFYVGLNDMAVTYAVVPSTTTARGLLLLIKKSFPIFS